MRGGARRQLEFENGDPELEQGVSRLLKQEHPSIGCFLLISSLGLQTIDVPQIQGVIQDEARQQLCNAGRGFRTPRASLAESERRGSLAVFQMQTTTKGRFTRSTQTDTFL
ncbi:hypothetical protein B5K06_25125 [Rhizobium grahamii]|uniref:Uncharacterized protein n=2 Tax=Rhizobium grahamii TaxID=1120045 RepID=S3H5A7_9HYPH|nr:hypothetical protein RGCCGE502_30687 [Rhizobium grahamii CCGE 502]RDJ05729.1 hypothetical protein B5K06_25125 [Rhizobium grahamii]